MNYALYLYALLHTDGYAAGRQFVCGGFPCQTGDFHFILVCFDFMIRTSSDGCEKEVLAARPMFRDARTERTAMPEMPHCIPPPEVMAILARLRQAEYSAYLCGGCVRDALLGKTPKDYDIASSAPPDAVERLFPRTIPIGKAFGVMLVEGEDGGRYEVATFRSESGYADGRRPDAVAFSSAEEDARRRDFTMNALFCDPFTGEIIDYVGGVADLRRRLVRTVGDPAERFAEDHLRLLRAVRFTARTGFTMEEGTRRAVAAMADLVRTVSPERVAAELEAMLGGGFSRPAFALMKELALLGHILPEVDALSGVEQPPDFHPEGDVWLHTLLLLEENDQATLAQTRAIDFSALADIDPAKGMHRGNFTGAEYLAGVAACRAAFTPEQALLLGWSGLLHDIGKPATFFVSDRIRFNDHDRLGAEMATAVLERFRRSRRICEGAFDLIRRHIHFSTLRKMRRSKLRRWLAEKDFPLHLELHRLDCVASHRMLANWHFGLEAWLEERALPPRLEPLLRGEDLIALGMKPGPALGKMLHDVEDARLEGQVDDRETALEWVRKALREEGAGR